MSEHTQEDIVYTMRLQRYLARCGISSRRGSERLISEGRVSVNGSIVTQMGSKVKIGVDTVCVDGIVCSPADTHRYLMLNKPAGYLTTMRDPYNRPCISSLIPTQEIPGIFPVGRLDMDTTGLLLCTTDGELANALLHPSKKVTKHYLALVKGTFTHKDIELFRSGIALESGVCAPAEAKLLAPTDPALKVLGAQNFDTGRYSAVGIYVHEGKKHQVKNMCEATGHPVLRLHRDRFGPIILHNLPQGKWRYLSDTEISALKQTTDLTHEGDTV